MLEGVLTMSSDQDKADQAVVVICHPHPLFGGDMDSLVVQRISSELASRGIASLRFNYRGVANSEGKYDDGIGEMQDLSAAITHVCKSSGLDGDRIGVAGYSFGASLAIEAAATDKRIKVLAVISPPWAGLSGGKWDRVTIPKLIVCGDSDQFLSMDDLRSFIKPTKSENKCIIVANEGHFWNKKSDDMARAQSDFFVSAWY